MSDNGSRRQVVVALGAVDPALVTDRLPAGTRFVEDPTPDDLSAAVGASSAPTRRSTSPSSTGCRTSG